jgi:hypothetical protein
MIGSTIGRISTIIAKPSRKVPSAIKAIDWDAIYGTNAKEDLKPRQAEAMHELKRMQQFALQALGRFVSLSSPLRFDLFHYHVLSRHILQAPYPVAGIIFSGTFFVAVCFF